MSDGRSISEIIEGQESSEAEETKEQQEVDETVEQKESGILRVLKKNRFAESFLSIWGWVEGNSYLKLAAGFSMFMLPLNFETITRVTGLDFLYSEIGVVLLFVGICVFLSFMEEIVNTLKSLRLSLFGGKTENLKRQQQDNDVATEAKRVVITKFSETPSEVLNTITDGRVHPLTFMVSEMVGVDLTPINELASAKEAEKTTVEPLSPYGDDK